ncbi:MAG TPA: hypothetical protein VMK83_04315 [Gaiellaceae bacterium]|nr:hypothetical protein [Gaiellaceae bacterium]
MRVRSLIAVIAAGLVVVALGSAGGSAIPAGNLVKSAGVEAQPATASTAEQAATYSPRGWERASVRGPGEPERPDSGFVVARYGTHGYFPSSAVARAIGGGRNFLFGGYPHRSATATQSINVSSSAADIDAGGVKACLSGYLGGTRNWADYTIRVDVSFLTEAEASRGGGLRIGPVFPAQRKNETTMLRRAAERNVPSGTRLLRVVVTANSSAGSPIYAYADNISVALTKGSCEPVLAVRCAGGALVATVTPSAVARTQRVGFAVRGAKGSKQLARARAPYSARITMAGLTGRLIVTATVTQVGSGPIVLTKKSRRC